MRRKKRKSHKATEKESDRRKKRRTWKKFFKVVKALFNKGSKVPKCNAEDSDPPMFV